MTSDSRSDLELLAAWRGADSRAGEILFRRHFRAIYRFFETKCPPEADELVQATFLACLRAKDQFRGEASFLTYLYTIARHELYRALSARRRDLDRVDFNVSSIAELAPTPRTKIAAGEDRALLLAALRELPVEQQTLLELHYWENVAIGELAAIFESPPVTIRSRLHRARAALRDSMLRIGDQPGGMGSSLEDFDVWARSLAQG